MKLNEDGIIQKYAKPCKHCSRSILLPYGYEFTCISCGYNVTKSKKMNLVNFRGKKYFSNRLKHGEHKMFCIFIDLSRIFEGDDNYLSQYM